MADPTAVAAAARQVAEFAAAAAAATGGAARAGVVRRWRAVRRLLGDPDPAADPALAADLTAAADRARAPRPAGGLVAWAARKYRGDSHPEPAAAGTADLLARAADRLAAGGLAADLAGLVAAWAADDAVARLAALQDRLDACPNPPGDLLGRLADADADADADPGPADPFDGKLRDLPGPARVAARTARLVAADLAARTADAAVWREAADWAGEWFQAAGVDGELAYGAAPTAADGVAEEVFGLAPAPGKTVALRVRPGPPRPRSPVAAWADLPPPPGWPAPPAPGWLADWHAAARRADADAGVTPPDPDAVKPRFARWVEADEAGRAWLHECLSAAAREPTGPAAAWWRQLRAAYWCRAYPDLDPAADPPAPAWPADVMLAWPVATSASDDRPAGAIAAVERYAANPADARVVVSDGPAASGSAADRFHALFAAAGPDPAWWADGRWGRARELSLAPPADPAPVAELAAGWFPLLGADDPRLEALVAWAGAFGLAVVRPADAAGGPRPGVAVRPVFADAPAGRVVGGSGLGLVAGDRVFREAVAEVSIGRAPDGFEAVEAAAAGLPAGHPLRDRAAALREAFRGDYLIEAAVRLYVDYWADPAPPGKPAAAFADALTRFLAAAYRLTPFAPASLHECPDGWVVAVPGSRAVTGRVRKVRRPGLKDEHDTLRVPALVEVE